MKIASAFALARLPLCAAVFIVAPWSAAQEPTAREVELVSQFSGGGGFGGGVNQVALSPDGSTLSWVGPPPEGRGPNGIYLMPLAGGPATRIAADGQENEMAWSTDGATIAFLSGRGAGRQIYIAPATGGEARKVTSFSGQIGPPAWSADGKALAFLAIENPRRVSGATQPFKTETGVIGTKPDVQRLAVVDASTGEFRWASPPDMYVYEFGWSPDGREIAVTAARPPGENNWWTAKLYAASVATSHLRLVATPDLQINRPRWSRDGHSIAYIGGLMSDFGSVGGDVYVVPAAGGSPKDVTRGIHGSANWIDWTNANSIIFGETVDGENAFISLDLTNGKLGTLKRAAATYSGPEGRGSVALSRDEGTEAYAGATLTHDTEIYAGPVGQPVQITHWHDGDVPKWGKISSVHWKSGRFDVQGWLVAPARVEPGKKYPMIVQVHGGPAAAVTGSWGTGQGATLWSQAGYYVFMPNPRGSFGEGEEFTKANRKDFGYGDFRDIMAGVDKVLATEPVDGDRLGLTGGSYGGYMTMWGVTQTTRFRAAAAAAGIADWLSYYGENSIEQWMIPYFGATVYDDPKVYAKSSPIEFIRHVGTPTLVTVGEYDGECPAPQSYEFWHALNVLGVKTELVVYPGEGHGIRGPENARDLTLRRLAWFDYFLK